MPVRLGRARASGASSVAFSNITVGTPTTTTVAISWTVAPGATGQLQYGPTTAYGQLSTLETSYLTFHSQTLTTLTPETTYHYRIKADTAAGVTGYSSDGTFTTAALSPSLLFPTVQTQPLKGPMPSPWSVPGSVGSSVTITDYGENVRVTRISDVDTYLMTYPVLQSWNADDSYFTILSNTGMRLYNGTYPHAFVRTFTFGTNRNYPQWSGPNPDYLYACHQDDNTIMRYSVSGNSTTTLRTFTNYLTTATAGTAQSGVYAGDSSTIGDNGYMFLKGKRVSTGLWTIICYDTVNDVIISETAFPHPSTGNNIQPKNVHTSRSGAYGLVTYGAAFGAGAETEYAIYQVDTTGAIVRNLFGIGYSNNATPHMSPGTVTATNQDCVIYAPGYMRNLVTNVTTDITPWATNKNDLNFQHINTGTPGWATPSMGGTGRTPSNVWGYDQAYQIRLDGSGQVRSWGFARAAVLDPYYTSSKSGQTDWDTYASSSRGGNKIVVRSRDLADSNTSTRDGHLYVMERIA